jgi:Calx-beta domain
MVRHVTTRFGCCGAAVAVLLLAGAASAGDTAAAAAPALKNVHARPLASKGSTASWVLTATATDGDHDLAGGRVQVTIGKTVLSRRIAGGKPKARGTSAVPTASGLTSAVLTGNALRVGFFVKAAPGPFTARLAVRDTHGHLSRQVNLFLRIKSAQMVTVAATRAAAAEPSTSGLFTVTRSGSTAAALTVSFTVGGTATAGSDYTALPGTVTIRAGAKSATITVAPIDDRTTEPSESVVLTLVAKPTYALGSARSATVTIADDDVVPATTVTIVATDPSAAEVSNPGAFTVTRSGSTAAALVVSYSVGGTATAGSDYTTLPGSVTIPAGSAAATIAVTPLTDSVTESSETVVVTLVGSTGYTVSSPSSATVTIADSTPSSTVTISATDSSAAEPANSGTFTVSRSGSTTSSLVVSYSVSGSATAGSDYATLPGSVTIPSGAFSATISVTPIDDVIAEGDESVTVTLSAGSGYTVGLSGEATVQIADDDSGQPTVTVTATDAAAAEPADPGTFTVTRTGSKTAALTVRYAVTGTATAGADYAALSGIVTIPAAQASATITVAPIDNPSFEPSETVIVTLSTDPGYTVGSPDSATVVIADNDTATVTIVATTPNAAEPSTPGTFTVTRTGDTSTDLVVTYLPSGTAVNGADYTALPGSVTIPAGASSATITVTPVNDSLVEGPETVILTLTDGPGYVPGTPKSDTVTIADND